MNTVVVYVHGLWLPGHEGFLLRRRLAQALGAQTRSLAYSSVAMSLAENAEALSKSLLAIRADTVHLVAHSLGGLVVLKLFELAEAAVAGGVTGVDLRGLPPGRIVLLGSPVQGSQSARRLARVRLGRGLMGQAAGALLEGGRRWHGARDLGVIAGDMPVGIGRLLGPMGEPNDGTVLVSETVLPGAAQQLLVKVSHSGMPYSPMVARQTAEFLRNGRFAG